MGRDKHYYSVPHTYIGQKVLVIYTRSLVQIYCNGQSIAVHQRSYGFGYTVVKEHLCSTHQHYKDRSPEYYIKTAKKHSVVFGELIQRVFERVETPEIVFKRCDGLLNLQRKTEPELFDRACQFALDNNILAYKSLQKIIEKKAYLTEKEEELQENKKSLPKHENIRGREYYKQLKLDL